MLLRNQPAQLHHVPQKIMRFVEVNFYGHTINDTVNSVSVIIRWNEQANGKEVCPDTSIHSTAAQSKHEANVAKNSTQNYTYSHRRSTSRSGDHLRPTDRLVLNALRARIPQGEQITNPVRVQELTEECGVSRRQAQICLKRLIERGLVERLINGLSAGRREGYAYKICPAVLQ